MQGIFISYRRQDAAGYAGRLYDRLAGHFGAERVFMDVEGIEPGVDFVEAIDRAVASCEALIVIIGPNWLATDSARKRRLDDPKDFVHIETAAALARHIRVVPVLVDGAVMPREEELPADLASLARRQAIELTHKHWDATSAELIRTLERVLDGDKAPRAGTVPVSPRSSPATAEASSPAVDMGGARRSWVIGGVLALVAAAVGVYLTLPWGEPDRPVQQAEKQPAPAKVAPPSSVAEKSPASSVEKPPALPEVKTAPLAAEKPPAPPVEKAPAPPAAQAAPPQTEKPATPPVAKTEKSVPAKVPAKSATSEPAKPALEKSSAPVAAAPSTAPPVAPSTATAATTSPAAASASPATPLPITPPVAASALPATLPRVGDSWEYRMRSKWPTVQPRTYTHRVTAVSAREVAQTISLDTNPDVAAARQSFTPDTRFVEWRGQGFYLLEFNPFLEAFGGLQNAPATLKVPAMPAEIPLQTDWYGQGRIRGYESVNVPAGTFKSLKVEIDSNRRPTEGMRSREPVRTILTLWYAPEVKRVVKMLRVVMSEEGTHLDEDTYELVRYRLQ